MEEINLDDIERAELQNGPSTEFIEALSSRCKIIAHNIELNWKNTTKTVVINNNDSASSSLSAM
jgi:hypothetical protein